jgi:hypothetical protein
MIRVRAEKEGATYCATVHKFGRFLYNETFFYREVNTCCFKSNKILLCPREVNRKTWMTSTLFLQWLKAFDVKMGAYNKKVALFTDHYLAHPLVEIQNIKVIFLLVMGSISLECQLEQAFP